MDRVEITESQILDALRTAMDSPAENGKDAFTTQELIGLTGRCDKVVRAALAKLIESGTVVCCRVQRKNISGEWGSRPAYRWLDSAEDTDQ